MKENIILFIIIGLFLITVIFFTNKEGFTPTTESDAAYLLLASTKTALAAAATSADAYNAAYAKGSPASATASDKSALDTATTDFNTKFATAKTAIEALVPKSTAFKEKAAIGSDADNKKSANDISAAADKAKTDFTAASTMDSKTKAVNDANYSFKIIVALTASSSSSSTSSTESTAAYTALTSAKNALQKAKTSSSITVSSTFSTDYDSAKSAVDSLKTAASAFNTKVSQSSSETAEVKSAAKALFDAATTASSKFPTTATEATKIAAINDSIDALKSIIDPASVGVLPSGQSSVSSTLQGTLLGDTCASKTNLSSTDCDWNKDPTDTSDWWNEHRVNENEEINKVKWNTHTVDPGDDKKYPKCYRNKTDKTNGTVDATYLRLYSIEREKEVKDSRLSEKSYRDENAVYDTSFNIYQKLLDNSAKLVASMNDEKERYKRDLSNASTRTIYSDNYEYYYEEEGPDGSTCPSLKCVADFGTNIGENLCCGQTGVLQNTEYVCPSVKPTCQNFKCGSKFGTCV
jgi:hypothetical protein